MKFDLPLKKAKFLKRYNRFFADIEVDGALHVAHVANTGSLKTVIQEGIGALVLPNSDPSRKLKWSLQALEAPNHSWVGVNTQWPNHFLEWGFNQGLISGWNKFDSIKREVKISKETRLDLLLEKGALKKRYVEIKNVTMWDAKKAQALFPDSVTTRGQKHLEELMSLVEQGHEAELVFFVARTDVSSFSVAEQIDATYAKLLRQAQKKKVKLTALSIEVTPQGLSLNKNIPIEI